MARGFEAGRVRGAILLALSCLLPGGPAARAAGPTAVATFESIGLYWSPEGGGAAKTAGVRFRPKGTTNWKTGQALWWDGRTAPRPPFNPVGEYRGSLVGLDPGTTYEVELTLAGGGTPAVIESRTWSESFPVAKTIALPAHSTATLVVEESGTSDGYVLYAPAPGQMAMIDVRNAEDHDVEIKASYVILRGLTLKGASTHAIQFAKKGRFTDVVIEDNDVSGWGRVNAAGFGVDYDSGIRIDNRAVSRVIVQRNRFHHPRGDANSWCEAPDGTVDPGCGVHPAGPHAVRMTDTGGNHVIRYNSIESDEDHYFADGIGGGTNFSYEGFPGPDSDIYGNHVERCWDNALEIEGAGKNVRVWGNYVDRTYAPFGITPVAVGPLYIWRNVIDRSRKGPEAATGSTDQDPHGKFIKAGAGADWGGGRVFLYHNTVFQRPAPPGLTRPLGVKNAISTSASGGGAYNIVSRNNIFTTCAASEASIVDDGPGGGRGSDFDHDLYNGSVSSPAAQEAHGIKGSPKYTTGKGPFEFALDPTSPGVNAGQVLSNFNDGFVGSGPDLGAFEIGAVPLEFGVGAYLTAPTAPPPPPPSLSLN